MPTAEYVLQTRNLAHKYGREEELSFPDLACVKEQHLLVSGRSGVGKTTLLHLLSGLLTVQKGSVVVGGTDLSTLTRKELDAFRGRHIGLVFQQPRFIGSLNALDNVLAAQYFGAGRTNRTAAQNHLEQLGIADKAKARTQTLSGGERQRLAIARALAAEPKVILADEPTSSLDDENADRVRRLLVREAEIHGATLVVVSHDSRLKDHFTNRVEL